MAWGYRYAGQITIIPYFVAGTAFAIAPIGLGHGQIGTRHQITVASDNDKMCRRTTD